MTTSPANVIIRRDPWRSIWRAVTGDKVLAASIIGLALLLAVAALLPQAPLGDPAAFARWFSDTRLRFGGATDILSTLGLFDVVHSIIFRALAGILGLALSARSIDSIQDYRSAVRPAPPLDPPARSLETDRSPDDITRRLRRYRITRTDTFTLADRFPWAHVASIAAHIGLLVMLLGLTLSPLTDWRVDDLSVLPRFTVSVPNTPLALEVSGIDPASGMTARIREEDTEVLHGVAAPGQPLIGSTASIFVRDILPALRVTGMGADNQALKLQASAQGEAASELLLTFDADQPDEFFAAPDAQMAIQVSLIEDGLSPRYRVVIFDSASASQIADEAILPSDTVVAGDTRFEFRQESHAVVSIVHAPLQIVIVAGLIICLAGLAVTAFYPLRRIWLVPQESGTRLLCDKPDVDLGQIAGDGAG